MASNGTPSFANTLVSGELSRPWTEHQIYETIYDNNRAIYQSIKGPQINNKREVNMYNIQQWEIIRLAYMYSTWQSVSM